MIVPKLRFSEFKDEWNEKLLSDFTTFSKGKGLSKSDIVKNGKNPCIRYGELYTTYGSTISEAISYTNLDKNNCVLSKKNQIIIPSSGETQIDIATASCVLSDDIILGGDLNILTTNENGIFLAYYLSSAKKNDIAQLAQGNSVVHLYAKELATLKINYPSKEEQTKIAEFLSTVDDKISQLSRQLELLNQYKKGVMQKIFSQEIRFKNDNGEDFGEWQTVKLGNYLIKYDKKTTENNQYPVLTSSRNGIFFQKDYFAGQDVSSSDTTGYNIVPFGYFTYRHMSDDLIFKFNINNICENGIVSTLYPVFTVDEKYLNSQFLQTILNEGNEFKNFAIMQKQGGSRTYMYFSKLSELMITIPELKEQEKIAGFLTAIDERINHTTAQLTHTKQWKKGLLQQMFV